MEKLHKQALAKIILNKLLREMISHIFETSEEKQELLFVFDAIYCKYNSFWKEFGIENCGEFKSNNGSLIQSILKELFINEEKSYKLKVNKFLTSHLTISKKLVEKH
jgi:hypothetical protein